MAESTSQRRSLRQIVKNQHYLPPANTCPDQCPLRTYHVSSSHVPLFPPENSTANVLDEGSRAHIYKPLLDSQTRVLRLKRGTLGSELVGYLLTIKINPNNHQASTDAGSAIECLALSYMWGSSEKTCQMRCNGCIIPITWNLYVALQRLRSSTEDRHIWADAICIDQLNVHEVSTQVVGMSLVFRSALQVLAWLGDYGKHTGLALDYLRQIDVLLLFKHDPICRERIDSLHEGIQDLYTRPWMKRIWIRREIWAAQRIVVACGDHRLSWSTFVRYGLSRFLGAHFDRTILKALDVLANGFASENDTDILTREQLLGSYSNPPKESRVTISGDRPLYEEADILSGLRRAAGCESTDPRDYIYAVLDMTSTPVRYRNLQWDQQANLTLRSIEVDYSKSVAEVFADVARYILSREGNLILLYSEGVFGSVSDLSLPSWVPDWRTKLGYGHSTIYNYLSGTDLASPATPQNSLKFEAGAIVCHGFSCGVIVQYSELDCPTTQVLARTNELWLRFNQYKREGIISVDTYVVVNLKFENQPQGVDFTGEETPQSEAWLCETECWSDDVIVKLDGGPFPFLLRPAGDGNRHHLIAPLIWFSPDVERDDVYEICDRLQFGTPKEA